MVMRLVNISNQSQSEAPAPVRVTVTNFPTNRDGGCNKGEHKRDSDLCAQWEAVDAARQAAEYSWFAILISGLGTVFLLGSLIQQWRTSRAELRAYVNIDSANISDGTHIPDRGNIAEGIIAGIWAVKNTGQTPAYEVKHWAEIAICNLDEADALVAPTPPPGALGSDLPKDGSMNKFRSIPKKPTRKQVAALKKGTAFVFVDGRIDYKDVFGKPHWATYRLFYSGIWPPPAQNSLYFAERGNDSD